MNESDNSRDSFFTGDSGSGSTSSERAFNDDMLFNLIQHYRMESESESDLSTCDPVISCKTGGRTCTFITCPSSSSLIGGFTGMESSSPADFDLDAVDTASADTLNGTS
jgi:hypothetical protein